MFNLLKIIVIGFLCCGTLVAQTDPQNKGIQVVTATIASGSSLSPAVTLNGCTPIRMIINTVGGGWTTANLTFEHSDDGGTVYNKMTNDTGGERTVNVTAGTGGDVVMLMPAEWVALELLKVRSGTSGTPVNQAGTRIIKIICQNYTPR